MSSFNIDQHIFSICQTQFALEMFTDSRLHAQIEVLAQSANNWPQPISHWIGPVARAIAAI